MQTLTQSPQAGEPDRLDWVVRLRGIAALWVLAYHLWFLCGRNDLALGFHAIYRAGQQGVDLFFVLSGFVIAWPFVTHGVQRLSWPQTLAFYKRRYLRIAPVYYASLVAAVVLASLGWIQASTQDRVLLTHLLFLEGFSPSTVTAIRGVYWTLPAEMLFYLCFPLILRWIPLTRPVLVALAAVAFAVAYRLFTLWADRNGTWISWTASGLPGRIDQFGLGIAAACAVALALRAGKRVGTAAVAAAMAAALASAIYIARPYSGDPEWRFYAAPSILGVFIALMLYAVAVHFAPRGPDAAARRLPGAKLLYAIGLASLGLYLWHTFFLDVAVHFAATWHLSGTQRRNLILVAGIASIAFSYLTYLEIEKPFVDWSKGRGWSAGPVLAALLRGGNALAAAAMRSVTSTRARWLVVLAFCILGASAVSLAIGKDINWDLKNYHYYNAYSLVQGRLAWDIGPAQIQGFFNPAGDLPFYFLVEYVKSPAAIAVLMSLWAAIGAFFLVHIAALLFPGGTLDRGFAIGAALSIGLTGSVGIAMVGSTMNEWQSAALVMASLYLVLRTAAQSAGTALRPLATAGLLAGAAVGLKLTFGTYALGLLAASAIHASPREGLRRVLVLGAFMGAGFLAAYGPWALTLWREFGNPFFPLFNAWFQSPYWEPINFMDRNYGPRNALQAALFPLLVNDDFHLTTELDFRDYRLAALYLLSIACLARFALRRAAPSPLGIAVKAAGVFALVSYAAWIKVFGIYRYLLPLELVCGALIAACVMYLFSGPDARRIALGVVAAVLVVTTARPDWGRASTFGTEYFEVRAPALPADSLVIMGRWEPMSYAIAFFRPDARFVAPSNLLLDFDQSNLLARRVKELIATHPGPLYSLDFEIHHARTDADLARSGLRRDTASCATVVSTLDESAMRLCRVERMAK